MTAAKRYLTIVLVYSCVHYFWGCTQNTTHIISKPVHGASQDTNTTDYIAGAVLKDGRQIVFVPHTTTIDTTHRRLFAEQAPHDITIDVTHYYDRVRKMTGSTPFSVSTDSIVSLQYYLQNEVAVEGAPKRTTGEIIAYTFLGIIVIGGLIALIIAATKSSCPFIYSFDGKQYAFDAEPLGGAICRGLERTDYSSLQHLVEKNGLYSLIVRDPASETQRIDELKLIAIDHDSTKRVVVDLLGRFHLMNPPIPATHAIDQQGRDITSFIAHRDRVAWQSELPTRPDDTLRTRDTLTITIPNPAHATTAQLVVNMGTSMWGGAMIKEMLKLRGDSVERWYHEVSMMGPEFDRLMNFNMREELFFLKVKVKEGDKWAQRAIIPATSPFMPDDRTLTLDLSHTTGDSVTLRIDPPRSFWQIDYVGMSYGDDSILPPPQEIAATHIEGDSTQDGLALLATSDDRRYILPNLGDEFAVDFPVPPQAPGTKRSFFAKCRGYYDIHLPKGRPEDRATLERLAKPGAIGRYSLQRYLEFEKQQATSVAK